MALWVARAGRYGEQEPFALANGCVVVGWDEIGDLSGLSTRDQLLPMLSAADPDEAEKTLKNWESQLWAFSHRIALGDIVVLPRKKTSTLAFGRVTGSYRHIADAPPGAKHQLPVEWLKVDLPRQSVDSDLRYSFGGAMTVFQVTRNNAENRIKALLEGRPVPAGQLSTENNAETDSLSELMPDLERLALDQITDHVSRRFRGHELERLVEAVLIAQGFVTDRTDEGTDGGVDILCGKGRLGLEPPRLCVQVKSQDAAVDVKVVRELQGVLKSFGADLGLIVAWGGFTQPAMNEARRNFFQLRLWDSDALVGQIQAIYDDLPEDVQKDIPLKQVWTLVGD